MITIFQKLEKKLYFIKKVLRAGVFKIMITIPLTLENRQKLSIKPRRSPYDPGAGKNDWKWLKLKNCEYF